MSNYTSLLQTKSIFIIILPPANGVPKVMFSYVFVHQSVSLSTAGEGDPHMTIIRDELDLTLQPPATPFPSWLMGTRLASIQAATSDIL